jgi:hypothetical protein
MVHETDSDGPIPFADAPTRLSGQVDPALENPEENPTVVELRRKIALLDDQLAGDDPRIEYPDINDVALFSTWERKCTLWTAWERSRESLMARLETLLVPRPSKSVPTPDRNTGFAVTTGRATAPRKLNKDLPISKFTPDFYKTTPFHRWYRVFERELLRENADSPYALRMLFHYVDRRCFTPWSESLSPTDMNDLSFVVRKLDVQYPDLTTYREKCNNFLNCVMKKHGVLSYSTEKESLWRIAYPQRNPVTESDYTNSWFDGLIPCLQQELLLARPQILEGYEQVVELVPLAVRFEEIFVRTDPDSYSKNFKSKPSRDPKGDTPKEPCRQFQAGNCPRGNRCPFLHSKKRVDKAEPVSTDPPKPKANTGSETTTKRVCFAFRDHGTCPKGDKCRYLHEKPGQVAGTSTDLKL